MLVIAARTPAARVRTIAVQVSEQERGSLFRAASLLVLLVCSCSVKERCRVMQSRRERASWFFSDPYFVMASDQTVKVRQSEGKGFGLLAARPVARRNIICYYPAVCRGTQEEADSTYAVQILTETGGGLNMEQVCDVPLNGDSGSLAPRWRNKPVLGHLTNEAGLGERSNAQIVYLVDETPAANSLFYLPVVATTGIRSGEEILLDYGPHYDRSHYDVAAPKAAGCLARRAGRRESRAS